MIRSDQNDSEIFEIFAQMAEDGKLFDSKPDYLLPESLLMSDDSGNALEIPMSVIASDKNKIYNVTDETGEDLVECAHPGGGTQLELDQKPQKDYGKVETIVEQHKVNKEIALSLPTGKLANLSVKLMALASQLDEAGLQVSADAVDQMIAQVAELAMQKEAAGAGMSMNDVEKEISKSYPVAPKMVFTEEEVYGKGGDLAKKQEVSKIAEKEQVAVDLLNKYRAPMGHAPITRAQLPQMLQNLGISGYKNWNQLFDAIHNVGRQYKMVAPVKPVRQMPEMKFAETDIDSGDQKDGKPLDFTEEEAGISKKHVGPRPITPVYRGKPENRPFDVKP